MLVTGLASVGLYLAFGRFAEGMEWLWRVLFAVPLFCAMAALGIGAYIRRSVIARIRAIDRAMQAHAEGRSAPLPVEGTDEIAAVAQSVQQSMDEIARHHGELHAERDRAQTYLDLAAVMFIALDADGRVTLANRRACEVLRCQEAEVLSKNWFDEFIPEGDRERTRAGFGQLMQGHVTLVEHFENHVQRKGGAERLIGWHNTLLTDSLGRITGTLSSGLDITEIRQAEHELQEHREALEKLVAERTRELSASAEQLRQSESRYRSLVELSPDITYRLDQDGRITFISKGIEAYGYQPDELVGRPLLEIVESGDADRARHALTERRSGDRANRGIEVSLRRKQDPSAGTADGQPGGVGQTAGDFVHVTVSARGLWDVSDDETGGNGNGFLGTQGVMHDITERKHAEESLEQERARLFDLLEGLPGTVCLHTADYTMPYVNRLFREHFGTPDGRPCYEVQRGRSEPCEVCDALQVLETGEPREWELTSPSGRIFRMGGYPFTTPDGRSMVLELGIDVTERQRAEQQAQQAQAELAHMNRVATLGQLAASLAHELNQPLAGIMSNAQAARRFMVHEPPDMQEVDDGLADIVSDARRAKDVIRRTRELLKRGEIKREPLDINEAVHDTAQIMHSEMVIRGILLTLDLADDLPLIRGDRVQLQQVILNLLTNGSEAVRDVSVDQKVLEVRTSMSEAEGVQVSVRDTGVGIAAEALNEIFDAFYTTKATGLGMGLAITQNIVQAHGGRLWAEPNPDRGMTFFFTVPAERDRRPETTDS